MTKMGIKKLIYGALVWVGGAPRLVGLGRITAARKISFLKEAYGVKHKNGFKFEHF
jgi:hypothetical protein